MLYYILFLISGFLIGTILTSLYKKGELTRKNDAIESVERSKHEIIDLVEHTEDIIYFFRTTPKFQYVYMSPSVNKVLGWDINQHYENPDEIYSLIHPDDYLTLKNKIYGKTDFTKPLLQRWRSTKGDYIWFEESARPVYENGQFVGVQGILRNITEKIAMQRKLEYQSTHDELTQLLNRNAFRDKINHLNILADKSVGLIICDINDLKIINDTNGHLAGDQLIQYTADFLKKYFYGEGHEIYRIGGDEFAVITTGLMSTTFVSLHHQLVNESLNQPAEKQGWLSSGCAYIDSSKGNMDKLFKLADSEMYKHKKHIKSHSNVISI
ncbi:sensor domain-containing diguanylate cyclase [Salipaludibacillus daqingensis]|uniref:sensor domain-containing diguanylate cyclase n=1 Tax=Salipaludibacillus daqingensis TaxID=3041001 RepID=UPI002475AB97|nr:GGDEF domain-containing protein [Salipaludibacillus daqingensis]